MKIGVIEGFYGRPYSWSTRQQIVDFLSKKFETFYYYAPKGDAYFRKKWMDPFPEDLRKQFLEFSQYCKNHKVEFGVGLSPYEIYLKWDSRSRDQLKRKLNDLKEIEVERLAVLFDDMKGDVAELASLQIEIMDFILERSNFKKITFCPTYYSDDPVLDRIFGQRPHNYLTDLGKRLDSRINVFWTGEEICSKKYSVQHLSRVTEELGRKPTLWDNYPVNDGVKMCPYLHLKPFEGRPAELSSYLEDHVVNPMNQGLLSLVVLETLFSIYSQKNSSQASASSMEVWRTSAQELFGMKLANLLESHIGLFSDLGLENMTLDQKNKLISQYSEFAHPAAQEILGWLRGEYQVTRELVLTQ